jgi:hypothetical protein
MNCKNVLKLCYDEEDFHVAAEWNCFATSYGKSPCDGNGRTVKWFVACANPQATEISYIAAPEDLYKWAKRNIAGIKFFYITQKYIEAHFLRLTYGKAAVC